MSGGFRSMVSEGLMRVAVWIDPGGGRAETAVPPGMDRDMPRMRLEPVEPPYAGPDVARVDVPAARRPQPGPRKQTRR